MDRTCLRESHIVEGGRRPRRAVPSQQIALEARETTMASVALQEWALGTPPSLTVCLLFTDTGSLELSFPSLGSTAWRGHDTGDSG